MALGELVLVRPVEYASDFPTDEIDTYLSSQRFSFRDPATGAVALCGTAAATQYARMRFLTEPDEPAPPVVLIRVSAREIEVWLRADDRAIEQALGFVNWLLDTYPCAAFTPEGQEVSEEFKEKQT